MVEILEREPAQTLIKIERPQEEDNIIEAIMRSSVRHRVKTFMSRTDTFELPYTLGHEQNHEFPFCLTLKKN